MKKYILTTLCSLLMATFTNGQEIKASDVLMKLGLMPDQFNDTFDPNSIEDELTIVYIPGSNDPFVKIYDKRKGEKTIKDVMLVGGFGEMMSAFDDKMKKDHLQDALSARYTKGSKILIDLDSEMAESLSIKGYTILTISKRSNKIIHFMDYGFDRITFFKELKKYEN